MGREIPVLSHINGALRSKRNVLTPAKREVKAAVDPQSVLTYIKNNPGSSGEQIAREAGADTAALRGVMRELIAAGSVAASGRGRGTRYAAG